MFRSARATEPDLSQEKEKIAARSPDLVLRRLQRLEEFLTRFQVGGIYLCAVSTAAVRQEDLAGLSAKSSLAFM